MDAKIFLVCFVIIIGIFVSSINAEEKTKNLQKREAEVAESIELEQELKRVKRIQTRESSLDLVKRVNPDSDPTLSRVKRIKRSLQHVKDALEEVKKKQKFEERPNKGKGRSFLERRLHRAKRIERKDGVHSHDKEHKPLNDEKFRMTSKTKLDLDHLLSRKEGLKELMKHRKFLNNETEIKEMKHRKLLKPKNKIWSLDTKHKNKMIKIGKFVKP
ncbi:hypothetical protein CHS0354_002469 [Potamilus streckersoni]|uniref:Uncharacterized protein n=1 Tax=Potamilus streckersoni TaxID=2493646 RepID=A0AAE0T8K1_9BIVA|nr:hypothetical protein CHS0354_002469 [Potamilus streckersoni]